jgi:hypothetical protein
MGTHDWKISLWQARNTNEKKMNFKKFFWMRCKKSAFATFISQCNRVANYHHKTTEIKTKDRKEKNTKHLGSYP